MSDTPSDQGSGGGPTGQPGYGGQPAYGPPPGQPPAAPQPGIIPLRPLAVGDVLSGAVKYIRENPAVLVLAAAVALVGQVFTLILTVFSADPGAVTGPDDLAGVGLLAGGAGGAAGVIGLMSTALLNGMLVVVLSRSVLGRRTSLSEAWAATLPRLGGLIGLSLLVGLIVAAIIVVAVVPIMIAGASGAATATGLLALVLVPLAIAATVYVVVSLVMSSAIYMLEPVKVIKALSRSRALVAGSWWRIFGTLLLVGLIAGVLYLFIGGPAAVVGAAVAGPGTVGAAVIDSIAAVLVSTVLSPFFAGVVGLLYFDQRIRKERFDVELARSANLG